MAQIYAADDEPRREGRALGQSITRNHFRYVILVVGTLCISSVFSNMITLNTTLDCMDPMKAPHNGTGLKYPLHSYTKSENTALQWAVSIAAMVLTFPFSYICTRYGAQYIFLVSGLASALSTALIPPAADLGFIWFMVVRVLQGLAYACDFAVIGVICARWATLSDISTFLSLLTLFPAFSNIFTSAIAGVICDSEYGWPWVHYTHGIISTTLFVLWFIFYTDRPETNRFVSAQELANIYEGKSETHKRHTGKTPYWAISTNPVVWAVWLNAFTDLFASFFFIVYGPKYNHKFSSRNGRLFGKISRIWRVLNYSHTNTGLAVAIDAFPIIPLKIFVGYAADRYNCVPERPKMQIYNTICTMTSAAMLTAVCFVPTDKPIISVILLGISNTAVGFNGGGYYRCCCLVTRQYADFVIAFTQFIKCACFFIAPLLVQIFVHDETNGNQWHIIFFIMAGSLVISNAIFCYYATDKPASFTYDDEEKRRLSTKCDSRKLSANFVDISLDPKTFVGKL